MTVKVLTLVTFILSCFSYQLANAQVGNTETYAKVGENYLEYLERTNSFVYRVKPRDTLSEILERFGYRNLYKRGGSIDKLRWKNGIYLEKVHSIEPGMEIIMPYVEANLSKREIASIKTQQQETKIDYEKSFKPFKSWGATYSYIPVAITTEKSVETTVSFTLHKFAATYYNAFTSKWSFSGSFGFHYNSNLTVKSQELNQEQQTNQFGAELGGSFIYRLSDKFSLGVGSDILRYIISQNFVAGSLTYIDNYLLKLNLNPSFRVSDKFTIFYSYGVFMPISYADYKVESGSSQFLGANYTVGKYNFFGGHSLSSVTTDFDTNNSNAIVLGFGYRF